MNRKQKIHAHIKELEKHFYINRFKTIDIAKILMHEHKGQQTFIVYVTINDEKKFKEKEEDRYNRYVQDMNLSKGEKK